MKGFREQQKKEVKEMKSVRASSKDELRQKKEEFEVKQQQVSLDLLDIFKGLLSTIF